LILGETGADVVLLLPHVHYEHVAEVMGANREVISRRIRPLPSHDDAVVLNLCLVMRDDSRDLRGTSELLLDLYLPSDRGADLGVDGIEETLTKTGDGELPVDVRDVAAIVCDLARQEERTKVLD